MKTLSLLALGALTLMPAFAGPLINTPNLQSINLFELTSGLHTFNIAAQSSGVSVKAANLPSGGQDYSSSAGELYDLYYSDALGNFDLQGEFLTIDCYYANSPAGCNVAEVELVFSSGPNVFANSVMRVVTAPTYVAGSELLAIDGNTSTASLLGQSNSALMSLTLGFPAQPTSGVPEPSTYAMMGAGLIGLGYFNRKRK